MTDDEIRDIARKYAEEVWNNNRSAQAVAEDFLSFLLHDHCVVEKNKIETMYKELMDFAKQIVEMPSLSDRFNETVVKASLLKSLFGSQIGKEVSE